MPRVVPDILKWARETAGLSLQQAADKLKLQATRSASGDARLAAYEGGDADPARPLLVKMAKVYRRPLLAFYLATPPQKGDRGEDFRTLPERQTEAEPLVDALLRDLRARQSMVRSILVDDDEATPLQFVGSLSVAQGVEQVAASMRLALRFDLSSYRAQGSAEAAFSLLRQRTEDLGIFVLLIGDLGSHHSAIEVEAFRGFALADPIAPFVVINDQDARTAWSFTLLHELAHLWIGASGVSGRVAEGRIERFCNDVASNILLPNNEILQSGVEQTTTIDQAAQLIGAFARERLVSRSLVAYRLYLSNRISARTWQELRERFVSEWRRSREARRERDRGKHGGPDYYVVRRHRLGSALLRFAARNLQEGSLTPTKAAKVLGVKPRSVQPLLSGAGL